MAKGSEFDVFLSHPSAVKDRVLHVADRLRASGIEPWVDVEQVPAGAAVDRKIVEGLASSGCCAVFIASEEVGGWVEAELQAAVSRSMEDDDFRVFLVLLPSVGMGFDHSRLPSLATSRAWVDLRSVSDEKAIVQLGRAIRGEPPRRIGADEVEASSVECPYVGYRPFEEADARFFWGRDADVQKMEESLASEPFLAVVGNSGSGKSSAVRASLVPALRDGSSVAGGFDHVVLLSPGPDPLRRLTSELAELHPDRPVGSIRESLLADETTLGALSNDRVCWVIDQFEDVFTQAGDNDETTAFIYNLLRASRPGGGAKVVLVIRSDFVGRSTQYLGLSDRIASHQRIVRELDRQAMRDTIERPAGQMNVKLESGLTERLLNDGASEPGMLPLLQYTLRELWLIGSSELTHANYEELGRLQGSLARQTDSILAQMPKQQVDLAKEILTRMVRLGEEEHATKRPLPLSDAYALGAADDVGSIVAKFSTQRLIRTNQEKLELTHDSLLRTWPQLKAWVEESREDIRVRDSLSQAAALWSASIEAEAADESYLLSGFRLTSALDWAERHRPLEKSNEAFLLASVEAESERETAQQRRRRRIAQALIAFSVLLLGVAGFALVQWRSASHRQSEAEALALTAEASAVRSRNPAMAVALALESAARVDGPSDRQIAEVGMAVEALAERAYTPYPPLEGHSDAVVSVAFSPASSVVASASGDSTIRLWDAANGTTISVLEGHSGWVNAVVFSPDGALVASAGNDTSIRLWDAETGQSVAILQGHNEPVFGLAFSLDSALIASAGTDRTVRLWDAGTGENTATFEGHGDWVNAVAFSPDGTLVASAGGDGTVRLWDAGTGENTATFEGHGDWVNAVAFAPEGDLVASASGDNTVRLWDIETGESTATLSGHTNWVFAVAFSPDGTLAASAGGDNTIRLWDVATGEETEVLEVHNDTVRGLAFSHDGSLIASASDDNTVRLWDATSGQVFTMLRDHTAPVLGVEFSPDGTLLASASSDKSVRIWDTATGRANTVLVGHGNWVYAAAFSPDGALIASASSDNEILLWDAATGSTTNVLVGHTDTVRSVAFSPDGARIASASSDNTIRVWNAETGVAINSLEGHSDWVNAVAFSPDGALLGTAGRDGQVRLWDASTGESTVTIEAHADGARTVAFSPSGAFVASGGRDNVVRIWDVETGMESSSLLGHTRRVNGVAFSPDGVLMASGGDDNTVRVWDVATGRALAILQGHTARVNGVAFSPDGALIASASDGVRVMPVPTEQFVCDLIAPYITQELVRSYLPEDSDPLACPQMRP